MPSGILHPCWMSRFSSSQSIALAGITRLDNEIMNLPQNQCSLDLHYE